MTGTTPPAVPDEPGARAVCEHFYASHCYRGMSIRLCMTCHEPDWDDLAEQLGGTRIDSPVAATDDTARDLPAVPEPPRDRAGTDVREPLGRIVHDVRRSYSEGLDRPFIPAPWEERTGPQQELDMRIGSAVAAHAAATTAVRMHELHVREIADERERIATRMDELAENCPETVFPPDSGVRDSIGATAMRHAYANAAREIREGDHA